MEKRFPQPFLCVRLIDYLVLKLSPQHPSGMLREEHGAHRECYKTEEKKLGGLCELCGKNFLMTVWYINKLCKE